MSEAGNYYVITLRGDRGPMTRQAMVEQLRAGDIAGTDRVRNAFGRPLGTVAELLGGDARRAPSDPARTSSRRAAPRPHHAAPAPRSGPPIAIVVVAAIVLLGLIVWALAARPPPAPATPTVPPARQEPVVIPTAPAVPPAQPAEAVQRGLRLEIFRLNFEPQDFPALAAAAKPDWSGVVDRVGDELCTKAGFRERFYARWTGRLDILKPGAYEFLLTSDDGSRLSIDDRVVVDNNGSHGMEQRTGRCTLSAGLHPVRLDYFQGGGALGLRLEWQLAGFARTELPATVLVH